MLPKYFLDRPCSGSLGNVPRVVGCRRITPADRVKYARENGYNNDKAFANNAEDLRSIVDNSKDIYEAFSRRLFQS